MSLYQQAGYLGEPPIAPQSSGGGALGAALFITPRVFTYNTYAGPGMFNLNREGLVSFMAYDGAYGAPFPGGVYKDGGFRVVTRPDGTMSADAFMAAMAAICVYGTRDEGVGLATQQASAKIRKLEMRCEPTIDFVKGCAALVSVTVRKVRLLTAGQPTNFDDGHSLCEARDASGAWKLYDVAGDCAWADSNGNRLSLRDVIDAGVANCAPVVLAPSECGNADYAASVIPFRVLYDQLFARQERVAAWRQRIYQIPAIDDAAGVPVAFMPPGTEGRQVWVQSLGYQVATRSAWNATFYP